MRDKIGWMQYYTNELYHDTPAEKKKVSFSQFWLISGRILFSSWINFLSFIKKTWFSVIQN